MPRRAQGGRNGGRRGSSSRLLRRGAVASTGSAPPPPHARIPRRWGLSSAPSDPASYSSVLSPLHDADGTRANSNLRISVL